MRGRWGLVAVVLGVALAVAPPAAAAPALHEQRVRSLVDEYMREARVPFSVDRCRVGRHHAWCRVQWYGGLGSLDIEQWWGDTVVVDTICGRRVTWSPFYDDNPLLAPKRCR